MKIDDYEQQNNPIKAGKGLHELVKGDSFKALVKDIQPNLVTLKLDSGDILNARSLILPEARIGEEALFLVKDNIKGQILVEMMKQHSVPDSIIKEALSGAGVEPLSENIELLRNLVTNQMPLEPANVMKALFFQQTDLSNDEILFLLREDMPANESTLNALKNSANSSFIKEGFIKLINQIISLEDEALKKEITNTIVKINTNELNPKQIKNLLIEKLFIPITNESVDDIKQFYREFSQNLIKLSQLTEKLGSKAEIKNTIADLKDSILFMNHVTHEKLFLQLPLLLNDNLTQADLIILRDNKRNLKDRATVYLSLDMRLLGKLEVYIEKEGKKLKFKFWAEKNIKLLKENVLKLNDVLMQKGYSVMGLTISKPTKKITLISNTDKKAYEPPKRYSFDMRV